MNRILLRALAIQIWQRVEERDLNIFLFMPTVSFDLTPRRVPWMCQ
jgi:hypothetical protein